MDGSNKKCRPDTAMHQHDANNKGCGPFTNTSLDLARLEPLVAAGAAPDGLSSPTNGDAPGDQAKGIKGQAETHNRDFEAAPANQQAITDRKRFSTLRARLVQAGYSLSRTDASDGAVIYRASRWGMTRVLNSLVEVAVFVAQVGIVL